jgi:uncharacterized protein YjbI with pentapeptide repeats
MPLDLKTKAGKVLFTSTKAKTVKEAVEEAAKGKIDLRGVDLTGADLSGISDRLRLHLSSCHSI